MRFVNTMAAVALAMGLAVPAFAQTATPMPTQKPAITQQQPRTTTTTPSSKEQMGSKIDINTATAEQLKELPGIKGQRSAAIIKNRPYKSTEELKTKKVVPSNVYDDIKDKVTVK